MYVKSATFLAVHDPRLQLVYCALIINYFVQFYFEKTPFNFFNAVSRKPGSCTYKRHAFRNVSTRWRKFAMQRIVSAQSHLGTVCLCTGYQARPRPTTISGHREELINPFIKAAAEDHTDADCLIVVAMSHGESGLLHSTDSLYPVDMLWTPFTGDRCSSLAGKPKLFFIQVRLPNRHSPGTRNTRAIRIRLPVRSTNNERFRA